MQFTFEGERYSFRFQYEKKEKIREYRMRGQVYREGRDHLDRPLGGGPGELVRITLTQIWHVTYCILSKWKAEKWMPVCSQKALCSPKDQFSRAIGREIALGKYKHSDPLKYPAMREAWKNRTQTPAKSSQPPQPSSVHPEPESH